MIENLGPAHLLLTADSTSTLCGLTPPPFPHGVVTTLDWPDAPESVVLDRQTILLEPYVCQDCVAGYYRWKATQ